MTSLSGAALLVAEMIALLLVVTLAVTLLQRRLGDATIRRWMGGPPRRAALKGIAVGFITPFCTYSAIPVLVGMRQAGVRLLVPGRSLVGRMAERVPGSVAPCCGAVEEHGLADRGGCGRRTRPEFALLTKVARGRVVGAFFAYVFVVAMVAGLLTDLIL